MDTSTATMTRPLTMSIAAVERDTGLSKDTLRVWERRYGYPAPMRDPLGERCYPLDQVEKLRLIKRLLDVGHRPGRLIGLPQDDLQALSERSADAQGLTGPTRRRGLRPRLPSGPAEPPRNGRAHLLSVDAAPPWSGDCDAAQSSASTWLNACLTHIDQHNPLGLRHELSLALVELGLTRFISERITPLLQAVGTGWLRGRFQIYQEHWVSHQVQQALHGAIHTLPPPRRHHLPRVLLSTLPGEHHSLGLLVVEAWLHLEQAHPINLGPQTPLWDLAHATRSCQVDIVTLSFSPHAAPTLIQEGLADLRSKLPGHIEIWAGGSHPMLQRRDFDGVRIMPDMTALSAALHDWRARHPVDTNP